MSELHSFPYDKEKFADIRGYRFGKNWPVVYIMEDGKEAYVGETVNAYNRSRQHHEKLERRKLKTIHILSDEEFNKSAALDIESWIIQYMAADQKYTLQNGNGGLKNHNYFDRAKYKAKFELAWAKMREMGLANNTLLDLKNSDLFKYSPYKSLTEDQFVVARAIQKKISSNEKTVHVVHGRPGTGKTILATYLFKYLKEEEDTKDMEITLVVSMTSLRKTIKKVFRKIKGLSPAMVIGPNDVVRKKYDLLLVDEAHRLRKRKNITNYAAFDTINQQLGLGNEGTELDWITQSSSHQVFFYDAQQSVRPSDIGPEYFEAMGAVEHTLTTQMRMEAGEDFIKFVDDFFAQVPIQKKDFGEYDFRVYDNVQQMANDIKEKDKEHGLSRLVAGYAWPWQTRHGSDKHDIEIDGFRGIWNTTNTDWVNSPNAADEVGCIHTVQGYDLNYVGVIIGPEFGYDPEKKEFFVDRQQYFDRNGHAGVHDPEELLQYIINIYKTLLTRGMKGVYVYVCDQGLRGYLQDYLRV